MSETVYNEEAFEYCLRNFLQWLNVLTMNPKELCDAWGNYNVAWELVSDLKADGNAIVTMTGSYLSELQKQKVSAFLGTLNSIPESLLVSAPSISANVEAMSHSCWSPFRDSALALIAVLEPATIRNKEYFFKPRITTGSARPEEA